MPRSRIRWSTVTFLVVLGLIGAVVVSEDGPPWSSERRILDQRVVESSGLAVSGYDDGVLWTHNDSSYGPHLYAIGPDGQGLAQVTLPGAQARDWEALAPGRGSGGEPELWIGDIGNNQGLWPTLEILRINEPESFTDAEVSWQSFEFRYPDGRHNAEALLLDPTDQGLFVVPKNGAGVYAAPAEPDPNSINELTRIADAPRGVTDGAFSPDGTRVALVGYITVCPRPGCNGRLRLVKVVRDRDEIALLLHGARAPPRAPPPGQLSLLPV